MGGLKETPYRILMQDKPELAMRVAVRGMMSRNTVTKDSLKRLHIYAGAEYEQQAQKPIALDVSRPKYSSMSRPLMVMAPVPLGNRCTRATEDFRRPVPYR